MPITFDQYQSGASRTANPKLNPDERRVVALLGLAGEAGEVCDLVKKHLGHGADLDRDALVKELGDVLWYLSETCSAYGIPLEDVASRNLDKLRKRWPTGFQEAQDQAARAREVG